MMKQTIGCAVLVAITACGASNQSHDSRPDAAAAPPTRDAEAGSADADAGAPACTPNTTTCASGALVTCDASGEPSRTQTCALGCSADATRCAQFVPSNGLGVFYQMVGDPPDLALGGGVLDPDTGILTDASGTTTLPSFVAPAPAGGPAIRVFVGHRISITGQLIVEDKKTEQTSRGLGTAVAFLATDELDVSGELWVLSGAVDVAGCTGAGGTAHDQLFTGGGGGGFATAGAHGGDIKLGAIAIPHGDGGGTDGSDALVPLRGGCPGGGGGNDTLGGTGGGAVQLVSLVKVDVSGIVNVDAFGGAPGAGGGGGGGVLIEAPEVALENSAFVLARGGAGAGGDEGEQDDGTASGAALAGGPCQTGPSNPCSSGGAGATSSSSGDVSATAPGGITATSGQLAFAGGGGGGLGRARINTASGALASSTATIAAHLSVAPVATE